MVPKPVLLYSGGIDSFLARYYLKTKFNIDPYLVYYCVRCRYSREELEFIIGQLGSDIVIDTTFNFGDIEEESSFIPNRNLHFAMHAAAKYNKKVYIGGTASDRVSDNNEEMMDTLTYVVNRSLSCEDIHITSPFWNSHKCQLAENYVSEHDDKINAVLDLAFDTFSCYSPSIKSHIVNIKLNGAQRGRESKECLKCKACFRKGTILNSIGAFRSFKDRLIPKSYQEEFSVIPEENRNPREKSTMDYIGKLLK